MGYREVRGIVRSNRTARGARRNPFDERRDRIAREKRPKDQTGERRVGFGQVERRDGGGGGGGGFDQVIYIESYLHLNVFIFNARPRDRSLLLKFARARARARQLRFGWPCSRLALVHGRENSPTYRGR